MSWVAVGIAGAALVVGYMSSQEAKKASQKQAQGIEEAGAQRRAAANREADYLEINATQKVAAAQQDMFDAKRITKLTQSRVQALAAASGGGATSPGVLTVMGNIAKVGALNASRALYSGEEAARNMRLLAAETRITGDFESAYAANQAEAVRAGAKANELAMYSKAIGTGGGLYGKYAGRGPATGTGTAANSSQFYIDNAPS